MVALPGHGPLSAARAGRHAPPGPLGLALPDDPGVGKPVVQSTPTLPVGRRRQPARDQPRPAGQHPGRNLESNSPTSVRPQPGSSRPSAPSAHPTAADPRCARPTALIPLTLRYPTSTRLLRTSSQSEPTAPQEQGRKDHRLRRPRATGRSHKPHKEPVRARRTTDTATRTEPQPGRRKQRKREGATVAAPHAPQELRNARS
jgi:hypothetical protein